MKTIPTAPLKKEVSIRVPGSKSYTHRALIAGALSDGTCRLTGCLESRDTLLTRQALIQLGVEIEESGDTLSIQGTSGLLSPCRFPIYLENSGTSMRLLTAVATLGGGETVLCGTQRMHQRPIGDLVDGLNRIGASVEAEADGRFPPVRVGDRRPRGGAVRLDCSVSSQFLSGILLIGPYTLRGVDISVTGGPVSRPYIDMTVGIMERFGIPVQRDGYRRFQVAGGQGYEAGKYEVEPDASQAGYFWAAGALTGKRVTVLGVTESSLQGDARFPGVLEQMGCKVVRNSSHTTVEGETLRGVTVDMADMPDLVPTLAVLAAFAEGETRITNVAHLRAKESDRLSAVRTELLKMGVEAVETRDGLRIRGGSPRSARIDTHDDHRMAMSFALAGLKVPGVVIENERCVEKSFPDFWEVFAQLYE
jgi:3-phosphoshikimate 1-carboxyvinyltransferase